jgi:hypothetical protein
LSAPQSPYKGTLGTGSTNGNHFWPIPGNHDWSQNCGNGKSGCASQCSYAAGTATANSYIAPYLSYFPGTGGKLYYTATLGKTEPAPHAWCGWWLPEFAT